MIDLGNMNVEEWNRVAAAGGVGAVDYRDQLIEMIEDGMLDPMMAVTMCVKWMSNDEVGEMLDANELSDRFREEDE